MAESRVLKNKPFYSPDELTKQQIFHKMMDRVQQSCKAMTGKSKRTCLRQGGKAFD
jgi:hypothetical protein